MSTNFFDKYKSDFIKTLNLIQNRDFNKCIKLLKGIRKKKGRLFIIGVGGSSANASHAVNDFRKICNIEAYCPSDNVSELTARTNDDGFEHIFSSWLETSNITNKDLLMIFSVGGGNLKKKVSVNIINAIKYANKKKVKSISFIGKKDGYAFKNSTVPVLFKISRKDFITPISEAMQAVLWHAIVSDPNLKYNKTKW
tara:strand:+ start:505 stop:1095 length:591 start_codon:yes stop_codon:yes gene_type:complete